MGLFKSKRDIPDEEIYRPGDRYFDPELVKSSDLMRRWSDLYNAHEASTHVVEEGYTAEIAVVGTLYDTFYMTGDVDVPGAVEMCFTPEQIREHPEYVTYNAFIPPHQLGYTMDEVDTSRTHCSVVNYVAVPEGYSVAGRTAGSTSTTRRTTCAASRCRRCSSPGSTSSRPWGI